MGQQERQQRQEFIHRTSRWCLIRSTWLTCLNLTSYFLFDRGCSGERRKFCQGYVFLVLSECGPTSIAHERSPECGSSDVLCVVRGRPLDCVDDPLSLCEEKK